jgi:hypothetical protein
MLVSITGCTNTDNTDDNASALFSKMGGKSASNAGGIVYDEDFSLSGEITGITRHISIKDPYTGEWVDNAYIYDAVTFERLVVDFPRNDGEKFYQVYVTTHDPESTVGLYPGQNYTYLYKADKFSDDYLIGFYDLELRYSGLMPTEIIADKMRDINETFHIAPVEDSLFHMFVSMDEILVDGTEPELVDRNHYVALEILSKYISTSKDLFKVGEIVKANGHITIKEIDAEYNDVKHLKSQYLS